MRISTSQMYSQSVNSMLDGQARLTKTQLQLSTGRRILTPADDPAGAARVLDLNQALATTKQYQANTDAARARLGLEDATMTSVGDLLQRVRELAVQANNATQSDETRRFIALEVRERLGQLLDYANTRDANGEYLFAGFEGRTQPFARTASGFRYSGDQGTRFVQIGPTAQVANGDSGSDVFQAIRNGNGVFTTRDNPANSGSGVINPGSVSGAFVPDTYTISFTQALPTDPITYTVTGVVSGVVIPSTNYVDGAEISFNGVKLSITGTPADGDDFTVTPSANQDMFTTVQNLVSALEAGSGSPAAQAAITNALNRSLIDIDQALGNILDVRARIGARLNTVDSQRDLNDGYLLQLEQTLSDVQDLDYAEAASRLNRQLLSLEAAQQTFVRVQGLSLFNFLR